MSDWKRKSDGVDWRDVWEWCAELRDRYGLWAVVQLQPPLPSRERTVACVVVVECTRYLEGNRVEKLTRWRELKHRTKCDPAMMALQLVSGLAMQLDQEAYEAERQAAIQGRLL